MVYRDTTELIGNTPLVEISSKIHGLKNVNIYAKLEIYNPFGSVKDRTAYGMLKEHIEKIKKENRTVIEASSGNTAKALNILCSMNDIPFKTVTNRIKVPETRDVLKVTGAVIEELPGLSECPDPNDPNDPVKYIENLISKNPKEYFHTSQYTNLDNPKIHYETTGKEIWDDLEGNVDYFFGTLGTTGSSRGISEYLSEKNHNLKKIGIIASKGDNIPGIRNIDEMYEVGIFEKRLYDDIVDVNSMESLDAMQILISKCGILGGPTSGACYQGMISYLHKIDASFDKKINVVFVVCDRFESYISYIKKRKPEIFNSDIRKDSIWTLTEEDDKYMKIININEALNFIKENSPLIIDLRGNLAYRNGHIKGSINILDTYFEELIDNTIPFPKEQKILLVCPSGLKSKQFSILLNKKGLDVYSLDGGIIEWHNNNYSLERIVIKK